MTRLEGLGYPKLRKRADELWNDDDQHTAESGTMYGLDTSIDEDLPDTTKIAVTVELTEVLRPTWALLGGFVISPDGAIERGPIVPDRR